MTVRHTLLTTTVAILLVSVLRLPYLTSLALGCADCNGDPQSSECQHENVNPCAALVAQCFTNYVPDDCNPNVVYAYAQITLNTSTFYYCQLDDNPGDTCSMKSQDCGTAQEYSDAGCTKKTARSTTVSACTASGPPCQN